MGAIDQAVDWSQIVSESSKVQFMIDAQSNLLGK